MTSDARAIAATLLAALGASQSALIALNPVLPAIADDFDVSVAVAGQLRTVSGLVAGVTALATGLLAARVGLRELLAAGLGILAIASVLTAAAPGFVAIVLAQALVGAGIGLSYSVAVAAVGEWSSASERSRVLSISLLGPPLAWVVGMPIVGLVGEWSWRLGWLVLPLVIALLAASLLFRRPATPAAEVRADLRSVFRQPGVLRFSGGELLAFSGWAGTLVFAGALFIDSYDLSIAETGLVLGFGALVYVPGNLLFRRWIDAHTRLLLVGLALVAAATVAVLGAFRESLWLSIAVFCLLSFLAGGRTLAGGARSLDLAPTLRLGVTGVRTAALQLGYFVGAAVGGAALGLAGYTGLGIALASLFLAGAITYLPPWVSPPPAPLP
jgi:MFS transporter, DHA1 family, inner membrane transport protein